MVFQQVHLLNILDRLEECDHVFPASVVKHGDALIGELVGSTVDREHIAVLGGQVSDDVAHPCGGLLLAEHVHFGHCCLLTSLQYSNVAECVRFDIFVANVVKVLLGIAFDL